MFRPVFTLNSECEVRVVSLEPFRIRITGNGPDSPDFEIEGDPSHISNAVSVISDLANALTSHRRPGNA